MAKKTFIIMTKTHTKHAKIAKPDYGNFGRKELAIMGTPCSEIKLLSDKIANKLTPKFKTCFLDADHKGAEEETKTLSLQAGHESEYVDKINFHRFDQKTKPSTFDFKSTLNDIDLAIVNGNHFEGKRQILVIDSRKSLEKKLYKLTHVVLILFKNSEEAAPKYIKQYVEDFDDIPQLKLDDTDAIADFIINWMTKAIAPIKGMVLAGGESLRMSRDKTILNYHGKAQKEHMFDLLSSCTSKAYISVRHSIKEDHRTIADSFTGLGPYGAILSAFRQDPNSAWLITACDQPYLTKATLDFLISRRNPSKTATAFYNPDTDFPEPLITIWEPKAYAHLLFYLSQGYSCPRKVLINTDIEMIHLEDPSILNNVNTPEEFEQAMAKLN